MNQGEAEARPSISNARAIIDLIELIPDVFLIVRTDSDAGVDDPAMQSVGGVAGPNRDGALLYEFGGIVEEQEEDLIDLCEVGSNFW